jgi:hypothetical protein
MDTADLRQRLGAIIREEERSNVDWEIVERMCDDLWQALHDRAGLDCPHIVFHFLSDADIRAKDADYGRRQRVEIGRFVESGKCKDSKPVSGRSCLAIVIAIVCVGALLFWMLR